METAQKTHPLVIAAAASVTVLSLAGVGAIFGLIPTPAAHAPAPVSPALSQAATPAALPSPPAALAPTTVASAAGTTLSVPAGSAVHIETPGHATARVASAAKPAAPKVVYVDRPVETKTPANGGTLRVANDSGVYAERAASDTRVTPTCRDCGTIAGVREVTREGEANGIGAVAGGVLGGIVGKQIGGGRGRDAMAVLGAVGGAYTGHQIEKSQRATHEYEITVRHDDGTTQVITQATAPTWRQGDRVRVSGGQIASL